MQRWRKDRKRQRETAKKQKETVKNKEQKRKRVGGSELRELLVRAKQGPLS